MQVGGVLTGMSHVMHEPMNELGRFSARKDAIDFLVHFSFKTCMSFEGSFFGSAKPLSCFRLK
jgi:hypothetical protein